MAVKNDRDTIYQCILLMVGIGIGVILFSFYLLAFLKFCNDCYLLDKGKGGGQGEKVSL